MKFVFTRHAVERCSERNIKLKDIKYAVTSPDKLRIVAGGAIEASKLIRQKVLIVRFEINKEIRKIITAFYESR
ncbi:MAG: DUF4258 domain-containing protein [Candidatus Sungbacteria bacterium]|nr:DUF4258 domain-containing protein [Candidatus Sungbacteria bacterium]